MDRIEGFDLLKALALFSVVLIHAKPFIGLEGVFHKLGILLLALAKFAVPCFFLISGYIMAGKLKQRKGSEKGAGYALKYLRRLIKSYGKATVIFLALNLVLVGVNTFFRFDGLDKVVRLNVLGFEGLASLLYFGDAVSYHLWFLPALIISVALVYLFNRWKKVSALVPISYVLHIVGVGAGAYNVLSFPSQPRDPIFFGLFFVSTGFYISDKSLEEEFTGFNAVALSGLFAVLHISELLLISNFFPATSLPSLDYSLFTAPLALSVFAFFLSKKKAGFSRLQEYGRESLWIYILHPLPLFVLMASARLLPEASGFSVTQSLTWNVFLTPVVFLLTSELVLRSSAD